MKATLVLKNGRIYTQEPTRPYVSAIAINGSKILAIGDDETVTGMLGNGGELIDLKGLCVTPGLVDSHVHYQSYALSLQRVDLTGSRDLNEALTSLAERRSDPGQGGWLLGRGWNQALWPGGEFPTAADLDGVLPERPVALRHKSGHAVWLNSGALKIAGIHAETPDPPGGQIQRDSSGRPTGILFEKAADLVKSQIPKPSERQIVAAMVIAQEQCLKAGLTGIHDFDGRSCFLALQHMHSHEELKLRVVKNIPITKMEHAIGVGLRSGFGDDWLRIGGVKLFADGALGPRTAAMIEPYEGEPENRGIVVMDKEEMMACVSEASANGLSATIHAIGDRANHDVLDVFEAVRLQEQDRLSGSGNVDRANHARSTLRHRIEHVQLLHPTDFERLSKLGILASMQPIHATADIEMADRYWGERAKYGYAWRTILNTGASLVFGSDAPVDPIEPLTGIYAAVTRRRKDGTPGEEGWYPAQKLTVAEAVRAFTLGAAFASGRENRMGTIAVGKLADLTIFDRDIFVVPHDELAETEIAGTVVNGKLGYFRGS